MRDVYERTLRSEADRLLATAADELRDLADVRLLSIADLSPARALQDLAAEEGAGLIVVGSCHTGRPGQVLPGSTAGRLLLGAGCPVALAPVGYAAHRPHGPRTIGAAWDGSPPADEALATATDIARTATAALRVVRVHAPAYTAYPAGLDVDYAGQVERLREHARAALDERVADIDPCVLAAGVLLEGDAADGLGEMSKVVDLMVIGSRGNGPLGAVLLGEVSGKVMRSATCPVLLVPNGTGIAIGSVFASLAAQTA